MLLLTLASALQGGGRASLRDVALAADNPIVIENEQPGSSGWQLGLIADDATGQIKGYASATSVGQNQSLTLYVSVNPAQIYSIDVYRIGWYDGMGARLRLHAGQLAGIRQSACKPDASTGLIACSWTPSYTFTVGSDWTSGLYVAVLTNNRGYQNYAMFVVRDGRPATYLYEQAIATDQAYNNYPNDGRTGKSLYAYNSFGANTIAGDARAVKVSFDRPYADDGSGNFFYWEVDLVRWLERNGYDVTYSTDVDTHANGAALLTHRAFLSGGHSEYWSKEMYDAAETARDAGVGLAFFSADAVSVQIRFESSTAGVPNRVIVCYRDANLDPVKGATTTVSWRDPYLNRPEQRLRGVQNNAYVDWGNNFPYVVTNSAHWIYAGTGLRDGDSISGIVGYEMDGYMPAYPGPNGTHTILSRSPFTDVDGQAQVASASIYQAPSGAWVFSSGTTSWTWGLDDFSGSHVDARIQRITANLLSAFAAGALPPAVHDLKVTAPGAVQSGRQFDVAIVAEDAQGNTVSSYSGTVHFASGDSGSGVTLPSDSALANGQGTFPVTLATPGSQSVTVSDPANSLSTTVAITVNAQQATANRFVLSTTATPTAGGAFAFVVTAQDSSGNTDPGYAGTLHFTSSDTSPGVLLPPDATLASGQSTFSATLTKAGPQTITATDTMTQTMTGILSTNVLAGPAATLDLRAPTAATMNQGFNVTVTARDRYGNVATSYAGAVRFTTSDVSPLVRLPADYTFVLADGGTKDFSVTLETPPSQSVGVADRTNPILSASAQVAVKVPGAPSAAQTPLPPMGGP